MQASSPCLILVYTKVFSSNIPSNRIYLHYIVLYSYWHTIICLQRKQQGADTFPTTPDHLVKELHVRQQKERGNISAPLIFHRYDKKIARFIRHSWEDKEEAAEMAVF